jgi:antitoxin CptB
VNRDREPGIGNRESEQRSTPDTPYPIPELNRLRWKCRRGMLELDLILNHFLESEYLNQPAELQAAFPALLELPDPDLWEAIAGCNEPNDLNTRRLLAAIRGDRLS